MGRSVSYATGSVAIAYRHLDLAVDDAWELDHVIDWLRDVAKQAWPSFRDADEWLGREDHAILSNDLAYIGVSEYCGLVSIWLVDREDRYSGYGDPHASLCRPWCEQIAPRFHKLFGELQSLGRMSNGEQVFRKVG